MHRARSSTGPGPMPTLLKQWFAPLPYTTPVAELDVRPGGSAFIVMRGPDGKDLPNRGIYLEVVPNQRLVSTDAYVKAWEPSEKPFMTLILTFEDEGRQNTLHRPRAPLDGGRPRGPREDGVSPGLGHLHRPAHRARRQDLGGHRHAAVTRTLRLVRTDDLRRRRGGKILQDRRRLEDPGHEPGRHEIHRPACRRRAGGRPDDLAQGSLRRRRQAGLDRLYRC